MKRAGPYSPLGAKIMLGRYYAVMNRRAYGGRLPRVRIMLAFDHRMDDSLAMVWGVRSRRPSIRINRRLLWSRRLMVRELVHEMVHIARPRLRHGRRFEDELLRVSRTMGGDSLW